MLRRVQHLEQTGAFSKKLSQHFGQTNSGEIHAKRHGMRHPSSDNGFNYSQGRGTLLATD